METDKSRREGYLYGCAFGKNGLITECIILHLLTTLTILTALKLSDHNTLLTFLITVFF